MSDYRLMIDTDLDLEVVDMSNPEVDMLSYCAEVTSGWKKIIKPNNRRSYRPGDVNIYTGNTYAFTYSDRSVVISNPDVGDFIPPGYVNISSPISSCITSSHLADIVKRCTVIPTRGLILNSNLVSLNRAFSAPRHDGSDSNRNFSNSVKCWEITHNSRDRYGVSCLRDSGGLHVSGGDHQVILSQVINKAVCEGLTEVKVKAPNAIMVLLGSTTLIRNDEGHWVWEGEPITSDVRLSVVVGVEPVPYVEVT